MKKRFMAILAGLIACVMCFAFTACGTNSGDNGTTNDTDSTVAPEKNILVVMREASSGTREAFDKYVNLSAKRRYRYIRRVLVDRRCKNSGSRERYGNRIYLPCKR